MNEITEALYAEKVRELTAAITDRNKIIAGLCWEVGKGKNVSLSKGKLREATKIERVDWRTLSSGELRLTVTMADNEGKKS